MNADRIFALDRAVLSTALKNERDYFARRAAERERQAIERNRFGDAEDARIARSAA